jgi:DNA-directed RNA polymerase subunit RPC12/RpoP
MNTKLNPNHRSTRTPPPNQKMAVRCDRCGTKAEVLGVDLGEEQKIPNGRGRRRRDISHARHNIRCPNCGQLTQPIKPQGS